MSFKIHLIFTLKSHSETSACWLEQESQREFPAFVFEFQHVSGSLFKQSCLLDVVHSRVCGRQCLCRTGSLIDLREWDEEMHGYGKVWQLREWWRGPGLVPLHLLRSKQPCRLPGPPSPFAVGSSWLRTGGPSEDSRKVCWAGSLCQLSSWLITWWQT